MSGSSQGDTFTQFPLLPKELRLKIWNHALTPRVISFHRDRDRGRFVGGSARKFLALTTSSMTHETVPRVCAESFAFSQKRYVEWEVWDIRKSMSTISFDPEHDVVYFSHEFARNIDHQVLLDFAAHFSIITPQIRTLALPAGFFSKTKEGMDLLKSLRCFQSLKQLIIVLGYTSNRKTSGGVPNFSWSARWDETSDNDHKDWIMPDGVIHDLEYLKRSYWPDWKVPKVMIAKFLDEVLKV